MDEATGRAVSIKVVSGRAGVGPRCACQLQVPRCELESDVGLRHESLTDGYLRCGRACYVASLTNLVVYTAVRVSLR